MDKPNILRLLLDTQMIKQEAVCANLDSLLHMRYFGRKLNEDMIELYLWKGRLGLRAWLYYAARFFVFILSQGAWILLALAAVISALRRFSIIDW